MNRKLKAMRALRGKRQIDLSRETGISQSRISLLEGGLTRIREVEKEAIAKVLEARPEVLFPNN